ncbi:LptF/LptG family permease [Flectobacillus longus]|uniref:LptF/LptG family permease n=1 Tax=Flectobacillus longus TaxID=2984207 RepID=UPI0024B74A92|nr:LptF/LptG family permease [Flectobacillus longus]MDI9879711.1 LptF/LptG family permease [Flectobacillus longus]
MKKLDKLILKAFWGPFLLTLTVVIFIFLMRLIVVYFADLFGKDLGVELYFELFFYFSLITIPIALPLAMLISMLMTFGKLGEFFELTAIKSAGISISRALRPMFAVAVLVAGFSFWFNNVLWPWANLKGYRLLYDIKTTKTTLNIKEGIFYNELPGYSIKVNKKFPNGKSLKGVIIYDHSKNDGNKHVTIADSALMYTIMDKQYLVFELYNGHDYVDDADRSSGADATDFVSHSFSKSKVVMSMSAFDMHKTEEDQFKHHQIMRNVLQLGKDADSLSRLTTDYRKNFFEAAKSYYIYSLKTLPATITPEQKAIMKNQGDWVGKIIKKKIKPNPYEHLDFAVSQAKNMISFAESNVFTLTAKNEDLRKTNWFWHQKFTDSVAIFVMFLIGAPLGAIIKKGGFGMPVVVAIFFFILSYVMTQQGKKLSEEGKVMVQVGAWTSNLILFSIGMYFFNKARHDSRLFESDVYVMAMARLKDKIGSQATLRKIFSKIGMKFANN